jgi:hypothetical protein
MANEKESVDPIEEAKKAIQEKEVAIASRDWFDPDLWLESVSQLRLAEQALGLGLPGRVQYHLGRIDSIIWDDEKAREDHQRKLAMEAAEAKRSQLIAKLRKAGISAIPLEVNYDYLSWRAQGRLGLPGWRSMHAASYHLDSDKYQAGAQLFTMVEKLRGVGVKDEEMVVFAQEKKAYPLLTVKVDEHRYVLIGRW